MSIIYNSLIDRMSVRAKEKPSIEPMDVNQTPLRVGDRVAFNCSGAIALGEVIEIKKFEYSSYEASYTNNSLCWWYLKCVIKIRQNNGRVSTVKNPTGLLALKDLYTGR